MNSQDDGIHLSDVLRTKQLVKQQANTTRPAPEIFVLLKFSVLIIMCACFDDGHDLSLYCTFFSPGLEEEPQLTARHASLDPSLAEYHPEKKSQI